MRKTPSLMLRALVVAALVLVGCALPALAATTTSYAAWTPLTGTSTDYTTTMRISPAFPAATVTSDSRSGQVGVQTGASVWLPDWSPVGQRYGSSQGQPYLNLRPKVDSPTGASTTTYTFERGTPGGWAFVLGDVDADQVRVSATTADGMPATGADLGFRGTFNYCAQTPRPSTCSGAQTDQPTWDPATLTLTGNAAAADTTGATGWFEPTASLRTLTFEFTRRAGFPVYQTWFAVRSQDLTGTIGVTTGTCALAGTTVDLLDAAGDVVSTTTADAAGAYSFTGIPASDGFAVAVAGLPDTCLAVGPTTKPVDLSGGDATADFTVRQVVPAAIVGTVTTDGGDLLAGVVVTLTPGGGGPPVTATTDESGRYLFDGNAAGTYSVTITAPDGYARSSPDRAVTVPAGSEAPILGQDFTVVADPTVSGTVTAGGSPVPGVVVELTGAGAPVRAVTGTDGAYAFPRVPPDATYTISVPEPPDGYRVPAPLTAVVAAADSPGHDFALTRPGSLGGTVSDAAGPRAGVVVTVTGPGGFSRTLTTDAAGGYALEGLDPGEYTITMTPPGNTTADVTVLRVAITAAGESFGAEDFTFAFLPPPTTLPPPPTGTPTPTGTPSTTGTPTSTGTPTTPTPTGTPTTPSTSPPTTGSTGAASALPDTGTSAVGPSVVGAALVLLGLGALLISRYARPLPLRRRRGSRG